VVGDEVRSSHTGLTYVVSEVGILQTKRVSWTRLWVSVRSQISGTVPTNHFMYTYVHTSYNPGIKTF